MWVWVGFTCEVCLQVVRDGRGTQTSGLALLAVLHCRGNRDSSAPVKCGQGGKDGVLSTGNMKGSMKVCTRISVRLRGLRMGMCVTRSEVQTQLWGYQ